jgi:hypothetical protein
MRLGNADDFRAGYAAGRDRDESIRADLVTALRAVQGFVSDHTCPGPDECDEMNRIINAALARAQAQPVSRIVRTP